MIWNRVHTLFSGRWGRVVPIRALQEPVSYVAGVFVSTVVTRDLASGVVASGSLGRVYRSIGARDRVELPTANAQAAH